MIFLLGTYMLMIVLIALVIAFLTYILSVCLFNNYGKRKFNHKIFSIKILGLLLLSAIFLALIPIYEVSQMVVTLLSLSINIGIAVRNFKKYGVKTGLLVLRMRLVIKQKHQLFLMKCMLTIK